MKRWCLWYVDVPEPDYMDWIDLPDICEDDIDGFMLANFDAELTEIYYGGSVRYYESLEFTFRAEERTVGWEFVCLVTEEEDIIVFMLMFFGAHKLEDDGDTEYYESADWYYRVEWDYLDGEE